MFAFSKCPSQRLWLQLWTQQCRCKHKWHSKNPRPKIMDRRIFEAVTSPIYPEMFQKKDPPCIVKIMEPVLAKRRLAEENNEYEKFLIKQCGKMFTENRMILVCQPKSLKLYEKKEVILKWKRKGFAVQYHNNSVVRKYTENTPWENIAPLLDFKNVYITSTEPRVANALKVFPKAQEYVLLAGFVDDGFYTKAGLERLAAMPPIDMLLGQTLSLLNTAAARTSSLLGSHQQTLAQNLTQYVEDQKKDSDDSESSS